MEICVVSVYSSDMTKLDLVIERIRQLPQAQQDAIAADLEFAVEDFIDPESRLTDEQWADLRRRMAEPQGEYIAHDEIVAEFTPKRGR